MIVVEPWPSFLTNPLIELFSMVTLAPVLIATGTLRATRLITAPVVITRMSFPAVFQIQPWLSGASAAYGGCWAGDDTVVSWVPAGHAGGVRARGSSHPRDRDRQECWECWRDTEPDAPEPDGSGVIANEGAYGQTALELLRMNAYGQNMRIVHRFLVQLPPR